MFRFSGSWCRRKSNSGANSMVDTKNLTMLVILNLWSNNFHGSRPLEICHLVELQLFNLSLNDLSGRIPNCIGNIKGMRETKCHGSTIEYPYYGFNGDRGFSNWKYSHDKLLLVWKGALYKFKSLGLLEKFGEKSLNLLN